MFSMHARSFENAPAQSACADSFCMENSLFMDAALLASIFLSLLIMLSIRLLGLITLLGLISLLICKVTDFRSATRRTLFRLNPR